MEITLCHLYPELMNLYGDRGNVIALLRRCQWRGIRITIEPRTLGDDVDLSLYDIIFIGGGQDREQRLICSDFRFKKGASLKEAIESDCVVLAICGGYQLLGRAYITHEKEEIPGIGALDLVTYAGDRRMIGNVVIESRVEGLGGTIVGFENHSGRTYLGDGLSPLGKVVRGHGNNGEDGMEGVAYRNTFGTYLHGSLLPKNPALTDHLIRLALFRKYGESEIKPLDDALEMAAHREAIRIAGEAS
ncbi:MAG: type 1 glutamine amidotransferase [Bacillota bacterium]